MIRTVLVTGADSGFGRAAVLQSASAGFRAVGLVRDEEAEESLRSAAHQRDQEVETVVADLSDPRARSRAVEGLEPWALVNNAGYMNAGQIR